MGKLDCHMNLLCKIKPLLSIYCIKVSVGNNEVYKITFFSRSELGENYWLLKLL